MGEIAYQKNCRNLLIWSSKNRGYMCEKQAWGSWTRVRRSEYEVDRGNFTEMGVPIHYIRFSILLISTGASPNSLLRSVLKLGKENTNIKYQDRKSQPITVSRFKSVHRPRIQWLMRRPAPLEEESFNVTTSIYRNYPCDSSPKCTCGPLLE